MKLTFSLPKTKFNEDKKIHFKFFFRISKEILSTKISKKSTKHKNITLWPAVAVNQSQNISQIFLPMMNLRTNLLH
jgi:hypothetical protein